MGLLDIFRRDSYQRSSTSGQSLKGNTDRDPIAAQAPKSPTDLEDSQYLNIYEGSMFGRAMVDDLSEDMVRAGWQFDSEKDKLNKRINDKYDELGTQDKTQSMIKDDLIWGDGYIGTGLKENDLDIVEPVEEQNIQDVEFLTDYDHEDITDHITKNELEQLSETQEDYNKIVKYAVSGLTKDVHADRMLHLQMRPKKDEDYGMSYYLDKQMLLKVFDNTLWSIGQLLYSGNFKVIWTDLSEMSKEDVKKLRDRLETDLNVLSAFLLDKGDGDSQKDEIEFPSASQNISGIGDMLDYVKNMMSMGSKEPLSRLFGNQAGAVSGAEEDTRGYYDRIAGLQVSHLRPLLRKLTRYILWSEGTDPDSLEWEVKFNDLWEYDEQTKAEIELTESKKWLNYFKIGAVGGNEVAEKKGFDKIDRSLPDSFDLPNEDED